jgi:glyoxylase-like metal-dependent hydrolase (beta-lactamase superfamily II)
MNTPISVGDLTIHRLVELVEPYGRALELMPALTQELLDENRHWLEPHALTPDDFFVLTMQSYIVRTPHHTILVDSCLGNHKPRSHAAWNMKTDDNYMRGLVALNLSVDDIDYVMCTHLHADHVGWNTRLVDGRWVPTFPNARYVFSRDEHAALQKRHAADGYPAYADSVLPIVEAGCADLVGNDFQLGDHVRILPTPGHTENHVAFCFGSKRDDAVMTGDLMHSPLQMRYPNLVFGRPRDAVQAAATCKAFLELFCDTPTLCCTVHFPPPSFGRIKRWGAGFRMEHII